MFAAAFSTVASCLLEVVFYGFKPTGSFLLGALLINVAAYVYNAPPSKGSKDRGVLQRIIFGKPRLKQDEDENPSDKPAKKKGGEVSGGGNSNAPRVDATAAAKTMTSGTPSKLPV